MFLWGVRNNFHQEVKPAALTWSGASLPFWTIRINIQKKSGSNVGPNVLPLEWLLLLFLRLCGPLTPLPSPSQAPGWQWVLKRRKDVTRSAAGCGWWPADLLGTERNWENRRVPLRDDYWEMQYQNETGWGFSCPVNIAWMWGWQKAARN